MSELPRVIARPQALCALDCGRTRAERG